MKIRAIVTIVFGLLLAHITALFIFSILLRNTISFFSPLVLIHFYFFSVIHLMPVPNILHFIIFCYFFLYFLPFIIVFHSKASHLENSKYGYAKFATSSMIKKMGLNFKEGVVFGIVSQNLLQKILFQKIKIIKSDQPLSTLVIAPSGSGKTAGIIIPTLKTIKNSTIVLDIKGEIYRNTNAERKKMGHKLMVLGIDGDFKFNPFAENLIPQNPNKIKPFVRNISNIIFSENEKSSDKSNYFLRSAQDLFNSIALYLIVKNKYVTVPQIRDLLLNNENIINSLKIIQEDVSDRLETEKELKKDNSKIVSVENLLLDVKRGINQILQISKATDQFLGVIGSLTTVLSIYDDPEIKEIIDCQYCSVIADNLRKEKITIYLSVKDIDIDRMRPLIKWFFEAFVTDLISNEPAKTDNNITIVLDEFGNLGKISKLVKATTISRSYKLNQIFILQDLAQIKAIYSQEEKNILETNSAYKVVFQQNNFDTAKRISDLIGHKTDIRLSKSEGEQRKGGTSTSSSNEAIPLVTPQDILNLDKNKCLIITQGYTANVILADIAWHFKYNLT